MDPLSITTSVATLLGACLKVSVALRKFRAEATEARTTVTAMLADVRLLRRVLQSMEETFEDLDNERPHMGHIGAHWRDLSTSLADGGRCLGRLDALLAEVNKDVVILDSTRRQLRLNAASGSIAGYRQEVQAYKDALQLSLETILV